MKQNNREIEVLTDAEHILQRPNMYIGPVKEMDSKQLIYDREYKKFVYRQMLISTGFYRIIQEIIDNATDEAKRCQSENRDFKFINLSFNSKKNIITVEDDGRGFFEGDKINKKSGLTNIETALTCLRAGSNFKNENLDTALIGTNGIGSSATNVCSDKFKIETANSGKLYVQEWEKFVSVNKSVTECDPSLHFTKITFTPRKSIFKSTKLNFDVIFTNLLLLDFQLKQDEKSKDIQLNFYWDDKKIELTSENPVCGDDCMQIYLHKNIKCFLWDNDKNELDNQANISFINSSNCSGLHQNYIEEFLNLKLFENKGNASQFYRTFISIQLPPKKVQFQEQNKTRFVSTRNELKKMLPLRLKENAINEIKKSNTYSKILKLIKESEDKKIKNKLNSFKKEKMVFSDKYFSSSKKVNFLICEGLSALGSLTQKRNPKTDSVYALTGKIKNCTSKQDLVDNKVISEIIRILGLDITNETRKCSFERIYLCADADVDGISIESLLINLFRTWFPYLIEDNKVFILNTPLVSYELNGKICYEYDPNKINDIPKNSKKIRYLKGLGSLNVDDWEKIFKKLNVTLVGDDSNSEKILDIVFGQDTKKRKKWLSTDLLKENKKK
ncbi:MAG: toprim domain-containing protein [Thomasclavelia ramosa]|nr:toprim domain-containing protein [Thomasclavelia ramosa]